MEKRKCKKNKCEQIGEGERGREGGREKEAGKENEGEKTIVFK